MCVTVRHLQNSVSTTLDPATKTPSKVEKTETIEKTNLIIKDSADINEHKKSNISEKDLIKLVDETCSSCTTSDDNYYDETVKLTGSLLAAIDIPIITAPAKLAVNFVSMDNSKQKFTESLHEKNYLALTTTSLSSIKDSWGTLVSGVKLVEITADAGANYGLVSSKTSGFIGKHASKISLTARKISIPFAIVGTGVSGVDFVKEASKISDRKELLKGLESMKENSTYNKQAIAKAEKKVKADIRVIKTNAAIKGASFALSAVSTSALIMSVKNPQKAKTYVAISLVSSVASAVTSVFAEADYRKVTGNFVTDKKNKFFNLVK